jgi:hypothetical protein
MLISKGVKSTSHLFAFVLMATVCAWSQSWPVIQPIEQDYHVENFDKPIVTLTIRTRAGSAAYKIDCANGDTPDDVLDFDFSGDFECLLQTVPTNHSFSTYFTENPHQDRDWESRARFFASEVADPCGQIPELGRTRTFRVRGMKIILAMSNIAFSGQGKELHLKSFDFRIAVEADGTAKTKITEPPLIDTKWKALPCKLDNSVPPHFR